MKNEKDKYYDGYLKSFMDQLDKAVDENWDGLFYIAGIEGGGKSTLAFQMADYLDPKFNINNIVFNGEDFINKCINAPPKSCIVFDESYMVFNSAMHANKLTIKIKTMLTMVRSRNLFMIIVSPTFFDINKYLIIHRSRAFINVYANNMKRGFFSFYNYDKKLRLYHKGKKDHNIHAEPPHFRGRFTKWSPIDLDEYEIRKQKAVSDLEENKEKEKNKLGDDAINSARLGGELSILKFVKNAQLLKFGALSRVAENYFDIKLGALSKRLIKVEISTTEKSLPFAPELL